MPNQRLRNALVSAGITQADLAGRVQVDAKSVERWITQERMPHATTRAQVANVLGQEETYFWPSLLGTEQTRNATSSELVQLLADPRRCSRRRVAVACRPGRR